MKQFMAGATVSGRWGAGQWPPVDPADPLAGCANYQFVGPDKRFGNVVVYKTNTKTLSLLFKDGQEIGTTGVWGDTTSTGVFAVTWVRRTKLDTMKEAVACALMLHKHIALLRAFEP